MRFLPWLVIKLAKERTECVTKIEVQEDAMLRIFDEYQGKYVGHLHTEASTQTRTSRE